MSGECLEVLKAEPRLQVPGFTLRETAQAICRALDFMPAGSKIDQAVMAARTTVWPDVAKAGPGGLQHVVSVDNGANYAELWYKGGNWYAVTGAVDPKVSKAIQPGRILVPPMTDKWGGIYEIPSLFCGDGINRAVGEFLTAVFWQAKLEKGSKACRSCHG